MFYMKVFSIVTVILMFSITSARRIPRQIQSPNNLSQFGLFVGDDQIVRQNSNFIANASTVPPPPTTASPEFLACMEGCRSTQEYNPVCGTDMINYPNEGKLSCAQRCGKNVQRVRMGTCLPLG